MLKNYKTSLPNTKKNSNNINNKQAPASPEPSSATKRTLADRSPPIFPADLARQPSGKPKVDMDINYITNPTLMGQPDLNFGPTTTPQQPVLSITGPMDFGVPHGTPDWFQPIMAMITSQGQRLAQLEALLKENQTLRTDLATAQRRIKELESTVTPTITASTSLDTPKPAGSEASKWKSSSASPPTTAPVATTPSFATVARRGKNATPATTTKTSTRARTAPTKRQIQVAARTFLPPSSNTGYQYLYLPCRFRESVTNVRKKFGMLGLENWRILDIYHPTHP
ncbi:hypothetical protein G6F35_013323 [Rhizopus arrhizus]|nr:hypothetical protein G6F35_013323 [Rhizopus arrhizus]